MATDSCRRALATDACRPVAGEGPRQESRGLDEVNEVDEVDHLGLAARMLTGAPNAVDRPMRSTGGIDRGMWWIGIACVRVPALR